MNEYSLIPVNKDKIPNTHLLKKATGKPSWKQFQKRKPTNNELMIFYESSHLAIITGEISGITVIDLDGTAEQDLLKQGYELPNTPTVKTQSGGKHLYFKYNDRLHTDSKINTNENIDIRNNGGYVVAYGEGYEWLKHIHDTPLQEVPNYFIEMYEIHKKGNKKTHAIGDSKGKVKDISESIQDAYSKANYINMMEFLQYHGYDVNDQYNFSCIFHDHEDSNPSASIYSNTKGQQRYICFSHPNGKYNASLIDLWADLNNLSIQESIEQVLAYKGIKYKESEFIRHQKDKYHYNTMKIGNLEYIEENYSYLYRYMKRYELELRAIMDYAESKLINTKFSHNNEAIFFISKYKADQVIRDYKKTVTVNTKRANTILNFMCLLGILNRVPFDNLHQDVQKRAKAHSKDDRTINFYSFNMMTDKVLSIADHRANKLQKNKFKISTMTKDVIHSIFGNHIANEVYPDNRTQSDLYVKFLNLYSTTVMELIQDKGYTSKQEVVSTINLPISKRKKEYHFDKVISEIINSYDLKFEMQNKKLRDKFNIEGRGRRRLIYKAL